MTNRKHRRPIDRPSAEHTPEPQKSRYTFTEQEKAELIAQRNRMYPLDERIEFARIAVTLARQLDEPVSEEILELASTTLPWEDQTPTKYAR